MLLHSTSSGFIEEEISSANEVEARGYFNATHSSRTEIFVWMAKSKVVSMEMSSDLVAVVGANPYHTTVLTVSIAIVI